MTQRSRNNHNSKRIGIVLGSLALMAGSLILNPFHTAATASADLDTTPPTVSFLFPRAGQMVRGSTVVIASATDTTSVSKVEFYLDGALKATDTTSSYSFSWGTTQGSDGAHTLMTKAYDLAGNSTSRSISVTVDNTAPSVSVQNPLSGQSVSGMITVSFTAADSNKVQLVQLNLDGVRVASRALIPAQSSGSWVFSYDTSLVGNGQHTLEVVAYDVILNKGSRSVTVSVAN